MTSSGRNVLCHTCAAVIDACRFQCAARGSCRPPVLSPVRLVGAVSVASALLSSQPTICHSISHSRSFARAFSYEEIAKFSFNAHGLLRVLFRSPCVTTAAWSRADAMASSCSLQAAFQFPVIYWWLPVIADGWGLRLWPAAWRPFTASDRSLVPAGRSWLLVAGCSCSQWLLPSVRFSFFWFPLAAGLKLLAGLLCCLLIAAGCWEFWNRATFSCSLLLDPYSSVHSIVVIFIIIFDSVTIVPQILHYSALCITIQGLLYTWLWSWMYNLQLCRPGWRRLAANSSVVLPVNWIKSECKWNFYADQNQK